MHLQFQISWLTFEFEIIMISTYNEAIKVKLVKIILSKIFKCKNQASSFLLQAFPSSLSLYFPPQLSPLFFPKLPPLSPIKTINNTSTYFLYFHYIFHIQLYSTHRT